MQETYLRADKSFIHNLPKAELHVHLDGSLRPRTMFELATEREVVLPVSTIESLASYMMVPEASSLEGYLKRFELTLLVMQDSDALERIAYELVVDHAAENVRWLELRFCPQLNQKQGLPAEEVLDSVLRGMREAENYVAGRGQEIQSAIILCGLRSHSSSVTSETAELAVAYMRRGVCGFDLAGAEAGHPVLNHRHAIKRAYQAGLPITLHAGEGFGPESIQQAIEFGHTSRIGHGTRLFEDPTLMELVRKLRIPLEVCLTSNLQTGVVHSLAEHPVQQYLKLGIPISLSTDNRLMSAVTLTDEYTRARDAFNMTKKELAAIARTGFEHAFTDTARRLDLLHQFDQHVGDSLFQD